VIEGRWNRGKGLRRVDQEAVAPALVFSVAISNKLKSEMKGRFSKSSASRAFNSAQVSNHLACHHLTSLDLAVSVWARPAPGWHCSDARVLHERGRTHERCLLRAFGRPGSVVLNLRDIDDSERPLAEARAAMEIGANNITEVCDAA
jgi:hypothetical protein